ncbi:MAG TPA: ATP-binding protein [Candidatus Nitrosotenuis sp.]|nr:ATP-binding protein [Candidatus Nitrosotenuis sp.]
MVVEVQSSLLKRQIAKASADGNLDVDKLLSLVDLAYIEADKERRLSDRSMSLMSQELLDVNQGLQQETIKLKALQERYLLAVQGANDGIWDWDIKSGKIFFSPRWKEILGYTEDADLNSIEDWYRFIHPDYQHEFKGLVQKHLEGLEDRLEYECLAQHKKGHYVWVLTRGIISRDSKGKVVRMAGSLTDITKRKEDEETLAKASQQLANAARAAGMAEVATNVLHNIGNILNSVNTASTLLKERVHESKLVGLMHLKKLLDEHQDDFAEFITQDPKGKIIPKYIHELAEYWESENQYFKNELKLLNQNIDHIKDCIAMQQSLAKTSGMMEPANIVDLMEGVLLMQTSLLENAHIKIERHYENIQKSLLDRIKINQIFMNFIQNARQALKSSDREDKVIKITIHVDQENKIVVTVSDNGIGISKENLSRIFAHGFTTKEQGHGFGLHYCALAAKEMDGELSVKSDGVGHGASFTLKIPYRPYVSHTRGEHHE